MRTLLALLLAVALAACATGPRPAPAASAAPPLVVLVAIDGFRADYLDRGATPELSALAAAGVRAQRMIPSFPSITFPNHYTLATGLHPDRHGLVGNAMYDDARPGVRFTLGDRAQATDRFWYDDATPIWVSAEQAGLATATMFFPGSEAAIQGVRPRRWLAFDQAMPGIARVDQLLAWIDELDAAGTPARFATLYFDIVDTAGHRHGPNAAETTAAAAQVDAAIARFRQGLKARGRLAATDLIIVADHGMADIAPERVAFLDDLAPAEAFTLDYAGAVAFVRPIAGREAEVAAKLVGAHPQFTCWRKGEMPAALAFGTHRRIAPIVCMAATGWIIGARGVTDPARMVGGAHGYDPQAPEMAALFLADGPSFKDGAVIEELRSVDVYPLAMDLLGLTPKPHDGALAATAALRRTN